MRKRISFSGEHQELTEIAVHHSDVADALQLYFSPTDGLHHARFTGYSLAELKNELQSRLAEVDRTSTLSVLSALEAAFRIDYLQRCYAKKKDRVSRAFRIVYKHKGPRPALGEDILAVWQRESTTPVRLISALMGAFNYRHWLAHGRYWTPRLGRKYDYESTYALAQTVLSSFPFEEAGT
jgi:hypothetical protein